LLFCLAFVCCSYAYGQFSGSIRTEIRGRTLDTNTVVYDEQGNALRYYQYEKLLNSGDYGIKGIPSTDGSGMKYYITKISQQENFRRFEAIKQLMTIKSPLLHEGMELDVTPLLNVINRKDLDNKVVVLVFWNTGCPPCTESFASLNQFFTQIYNPDHIAVIAITPDDEKIALAKLKEKPLVNARLLTNAGDIIHYYQLNDYPSYVVTDKDHIIRFALSGISPVTISNFKSTIRQVLIQ